MRQNAWLPNAVERQQVYTYSYQNRVKYREILESQY